MIASVLRDWFGFDAGSVLTNLIASAIWVIPGAVYVHAHVKCRDCWRPAHVPVIGTPHRVCRKHADEGGHVHR